MKLHSSYCTLQNHTQLLALNNHNYNIIHVANTMLSLQKSLLNMLRSHSLRMHQCTTAVLQQRHSFQTQTVPINSQHYSHFQHSANSETDMKYVEWPL